MKIGGNLASVVVVLMAASSLFLMVCLLQVDKTVHHDLYMYGLQFSYNWATPYWIMIRAAYALAWFNIIAAITVQLYTVTFRRREVEQLVIDVEKEILRKETRSKESHGSTLPDTRELMKLFATATRSKTQEKIEEKQTELQGKLKDVTIELQQQPAEMVEPKGQESDRAPYIPTQTTQKPSEMPIAPSTTSPMVNTPATAHSPSPVPAPVMIPSALKGYFSCLHCGKVFTQPLRMMDFQGDRPRIINFCPFCNEIITSGSRQEENEQKKWSQLKGNNGDQTTKTLRALEEQQK
jgi:hypothetical protein